MSSARPDLPDLPDLPEFPSGARRIVERWDPAGFAAWRGRDATSRAVHVVAVPGIDAGPVHTALAGYAPVTGPVTGAAVVVMVLDAASVLGRDELTALDAAAADTEAVVFVFTGAGGAGFESVRVRDEALLRAHSRRYDDARILADLHELSAAVDEILRADPRTRAHRNTLRATCSLVERTLQRITATAHAVRDGGDAATADVRARKTRLATERDGGRGERLARLRSDVQRARVDLVHEAGGRARSVGAAARAEIDRAERRDLRRFPARMNDLAAAAAADLDHDVTLRLAEIVDRAGLDGLPLQPARPAEAPPSEPEPRHRGVEDRLMVLVGASAGVGLGRLVVAPLSMVPALDIASVPVTLVLGGTAAWWIARSRRLVADRGHLRQWAADATAHLRSQLEQRVHGRILETEAEASARIVADSRAAALAVGDELAALDGEARRLASERSGRIASCERDRAALESVLTALEGAVRDARSGPVEPAARTPRPIL